MGVKLDERKAQLSEAHKALSGWEPYANASYKERETAIGKLVTGGGLARRRRLAAGSLPADAVSPPVMSILAPILLVLMLVFFLFRKPLAHLLKETKKPSFTRPRGIRKRAPIFLKSPAELSL